MQASASSSSQSDRTGQHAGGHSGLAHPVAEPLSAPTSVESVQVTGEVFARPCLWCALNRPNQQPNLVHVFAEHSDGICAECATKARAGLRAAVQERTSVRLLTSLYTTSAAILVLLPFLKAQCDLGWPGQDEFQRADYTKALSDLRAAVGDQ